jgi:hypothetical protein
MTFGCRIVGAKMINKTIKKIIKTITVIINITTIIIS